MIQTSSGTVYYVADHSVLGDKPQGSDQPTDDSQADNSPSVFLTQDEGMSLCVYVRACVRGCVGVCMHIYVSPSVCLCLCVYMSVCRQNLRNKFMGYSFIHSYMCPHILQIIL